MRATTPADLVHTICAYVCRFMQADSRNFHCWSYWRLLVKLMGLSAEDQESYILGRIEDNFSNYSAWHERTRVLQDLNTERPTLSLAELLAADSRGQSASAAANEPTGMFARDSSRVKSAASDSSSELIAT